MSGGGAQLRLTLLGGFLGSGKTTWLRHHLRDRDDTMVVVNEFAGCAVDDVLLATAAPVSTIAGGCCCCTHRDELIGVLRDLADRRHRDLAAGRTTPQRLVLETSGLADPSAIAEAIALDPVLTSNLRLEEVVVTVEAREGIAQLAREPLATAQVACADRVIVTKVDLAHGDDLARLTGMVQALAPQATLEGSVLGEPAPLPEPVAPPAQLGAGSSAGASGAAGLEAPTAVALAPEPGTSWSAMAVWLSALLHHHGDRVLRTKGLLTTPAGQVVLQAVGRSVQNPELARAGGERDGLVLIGRGLDQDVLARSLRAFTAPAPVVRP